MSQMKHLVELYRELRQHEYRPQDALRTTRIVMEWEQLKRAGLVRLVMEESDLNPIEDMTFEDYTDQNGRRVTAEEWEEETIRIIELVGNWDLTTEYRLSIDDEWEHADNIGGCAGYHDGMGHNVADDWRYNSYVPDLMSSAINKLRQGQADEAAKFDAAYA